MPDLSTTRSSRNKALVLLALALVLAMTPWFSATAVVVQLQSLRGFSDTFAAWLTIAVQLGFVIGASASALLGIPDRFPVRRVIVVSASCAAAANTLVLVADAPWLLLLARLATGMFLAGVYPPALKLIATWFVQGRGLALGILVGALTVGSAAPHLVNALGGADWRSVIITTSLATLVGALVAGLLVREGPYPFPVSSFHPTDIVRVIRNRKVVLASLGYFGHMWELYAMWAWFATFALTSAASGGGQALASLLTFVVIASGFVGCVAAGALADRIGRARTTSLALLVSGTCCVAAGWIHGAPLWLFLSTGIVWGISVVADSAQFSAIVTEVSDKALVGTALTLQLGLGFLLTTATIWIVPLLASALGSWQWVFLVLLPGPVLGLLSMTALLRTERAQQAERTVRVN